ncbi:hypothetical protein EJB05_07011 [Eragrostis curvula]|uniref:Uncharacterized protein n=1 Tax=Eragrostis curvula TaxID=38414 RepID=A0A5J9WJ80_9POAL|nr:hypothetical protein EJB05_07011 [Eragrostis curvula]
MEDSVGEEERREQGEAMAHAVKGDEHVEAGRGGHGSDEPGEEGGFLSAMASKIGAAMAGGHESSGEDGGAVNATAASNGGEEEREDGHGGGGIFQRFMSSSHAPSPDSEASGTEEAKGDEKAQDAGGEQGGILSAMASKIGMAMSSTNGNGDHGASDDFKTSNDDAVDHRKGEEKEKSEEANGGGILSAMASKIGTAMSGANGNGEHNTVGDAVDHSTGEDKEKSDEANGGGILSAMASKISTAMSGANGNGEHSTVGDAVDHSTGEEKAEEDEANGAGILSTMASKIGMAMSGANGNGERNTKDDDKTSNGDAADGSKVEEKAKGEEANGGGLVDQIMSNLPSDDQAPEAEEASLLIAIIED